MIAGPIAEALRHLSNIWGDAYNTKPPLHQIAREAEAAMKILRRVVAEIPGPNPGARANPDMFDESLVTGERPYRLRRKKPTQENG